MHRSALPPSDYDRAADFYLNFLQERLPDPDFFFHQNVRVMLEMLGAVDGRRVCDLACGEGFLSRALAARGATVTGIDLSINLLLHARRQSPGPGLTFVRDDAQTLHSVKDASFDAVVCHMALMDIPDHEATTQAVYRTLKPGGRFVFCVLHPCFETPFDIENPPFEVDDEGNFITLRITTYSEEGKWFSGGSGVRGTFGSIHRTLSTYLNVPIRAGFVLDQIAEPTFREQPADSFDKQVRSVIPRVMIAGMTKA